VAASLYPQLRPLPMFLGVVPTGPSSMCFSAGAFTPPIRKVDKASPEKIKSRVHLNFAFFLSNYVLISSMVALVVALMCVLLRAVFSKRDERRGEPYINSCSPLPPLCLTLLCLYLLNESD